MVRPSLDRDSFQKLLACVFAVQQSLDVQSPSTILEAQHLILNGRLDVNMAMHLVAGCARNVAGASGVAIGLLQGDQLAYLAGSGSAASYIGRRLRAALSVASSTSEKSEILRVEDAAKETKIGAAICRQFEAKSLLILPIYCDQRLAGVIEVFFNEAHVFEDGEMCSYQLMTRTLGEDLARAARAEQKKGRAVQLRATMPAAPETTRPMPRFISNNAPLPNMCPPQPSWKAPTLSIQKLPSHHVSLPRTERRIGQRVLSLVSLSHRWKVTNLVAIMFVLVATAWLGYSSGHSTVRSAKLSRQCPDPLEQRAPLIPTRPAVANTSRERSAPVPLEQASNNRTQPRQHVRIGDEEIGYVSEDVTIRHFMPKVTVAQAMKSHASRSR